MYRCFKCHVVVESYKILLVHFDFKHNLGPNATYRCAQHNCDREFQHLRSFRRHLISLHTNTEFISNDELTGGINIALTENNSCGTQSPDSSNSSNDLEPSNKLHGETLETAFGILRKSTATLALTLYSDAELNRKTAQRVIENIEVHVTQVIGHILKDILPKTNVLDQSEIDNICELISNPLAEVSKYHQIIKYFSDVNCYIPPVKYIINEGLTTNINSAPILQPKACTGAKVPLRTVIKKIFELPNFYKLITESINTTDIPNFIHSCIWQKKTPDQNEKLCCPLFLYFDDFESNNPLGSHSGVHSISAVYYQFPTIPPEYLSLLDNIFVAMLFNSSYNKMYGNHSAFYDLIQELVYLEKEGIVINTPENGSVKVYFLLGMILGDNLGLNTILGYSRSFSSNYYCRICKAHKYVMQKQLKQDDTLLRNYANYSEDIERNNVTETGINEYCCFNDIPSFHVVDNCSVDIMHDIFEGVCHYDLAQIILHYTDTLHIFDLRTLNNRIKLFDYSITELNNMSVCIKREHLTQRKFKMSASEMMSFVHLFPLLVGDLVSVDDPVWQFLIILLKIIDIILRNFLDSPTVIMLESLIYEHHQSYLTLFRDTLKPKHHFMVHYPHIIKQVGPLRQLWCMRFEAKHKVLKNTASNTTSRRNIALTLLIKEQLAFANRLFVRDGLDLRLEFGKLNLHESPLDIPQIIDSCNDVDLSCSYQWIRYKGTRYTPGMTIITTNENDYLFYKLSFILRSKSSLCVYLMCKKLNCSGFSDHFQAYCIHGEHETSFFFKPVDLIIRPTTTHVIATGESYCRFNYF